MTHVPSKDDLPSVSDIRRKVLPTSNRDRIVPIVVGGGLVALGALLLKARPLVGEMPPARQFGDAPEGARWRRAAALARDRVEPFAPASITDQIGKSLMMGGAALLMTRLLDEAAGQGDD
ncbi:hypothetical protein ACN2XU_18095 [Primorskyibacter sp. 2E107]|uniref:hypothetical protein n=1 Tax=Primorskyibacter sp. 2E107 TaxID=3403458 RepID=UPI003AF6FFEF